MRNQGNDCPNTNTHIAEPKIEHIKRLKTSNEGKKNNIKV